MLSSPNVLLCWESSETNSWNPVLAGLLRRAGLGVTEAYDLSPLRGLDLQRFDVCLPRFRVGAAQMTCLDEALVASGVPMLNSRDVRRQCENKALAHRAFEEYGIAQPPSLVISCEGIRDRELDWDGETIVKPPTATGAAASRSARRCLRRSSERGRGGRMCWCSR